MLNDRDETDREEVKQDINASSAMLSQRTDKQSTIQRDNTKGQLDIN